VCGKSHPTAAILIEIAHMEQAICWPARYLHSLPQLVRTVQAVAAGRSRTVPGNLKDLRGPVGDCDMENAARRLRLPARVVRKWNGDGLDLIARGLRRDHVRVI
jgi:hypothetical protein